MARSVRPILAVVLLAVIPVVGQAADAPPKEKASSPKAPPVAPKAAGAESPKRIETPAAAAVSNPERMVRDALAATEEARRIVVANLTNAETLGYKRQIVSFATIFAGPSRSETLFGHEVLPSSYQVSAAMIPPALDMTPGKIRRTGRQLDLAVAGEGFFSVAPAGLALQPTVYYTRCGRFTLDQHGSLVLHGLNRDWFLQTPLSFSERVSNIEITTDGIVRVTEPEESRDGKTRLDQFNIGNIQLHWLPPDCDLTPCGDNVYLVKREKHRNIWIGTPGQAGYGELRQGYIEESNVDPQQEFETLQKLQEQKNILERAAQLLQLTNGPLREQAKSQVKQAAPQ
jgi:flagellar basal-body rod protein FlgG